MSKDEQGEKYLFLKVEEKTDNKHIIKYMHIIKYCILTIIFLLTVFDHSQNIYKKTNNTHFKINIKLLLRIMNAENPQKLMAR